MHTRPLPSVPRRLPECAVCFRTCQICRFGQNLVRNLILVTCVSRFSYAPSNSVRNHRGDGLWGVTCRPYRTRPRLQTVVPFGLFQKRAKHCGQRVGIINTVDLNPVVDHEDFKNTEAPFITGLAAMLAPDWFHDLGFFELRRFEMERLEFGVAQLTGLLSAKAQSPDESLRHDRANGRGD